MQRYNLRPRPQNDHQSQNSRLVLRKQPPKVLVSFKKPAVGSQPAAEHQQYLHQILATPPTYVDDDWCMDASWWGLKGVFDEPIATLISAGGYPVIYYLNEVHSQNADFSAFWRAICEPPSYELDLHQIVLLKKKQKYVHVLDVIDANKNWIYPITQEIFFEILHC